MAWNHQCSLRWQNYTLLSDFLRLNALKFQIMQIRSHISWAKSRSDCHSLLKLSMFVKKASLAIWYITVGHIGLYFLLYLFQLVSKWIPMTTQARNIFNFLSFCRKWTHCFYEWSPLLCLYHCNLFLITFNFGGRIWIWWSPFTWCLANRVFDVLIYCYLRFLKNFPIYFPLFIFIWIPLISIFIQCLLISLCFSLFNHHFERISFDNFNTFSFQTFSFL